MAVAVDAVSTAIVQSNVASGTNTTATITIGASATIAVVFLEASCNGQADTSIAWSTLTLGGNPLTHLASAIQHSGGGNTGFVDVYYQLSPGSGSKTLSTTMTYTGGGTAACWLGFAVSYTGALSAGAEVGTAQVINNTSGGNNASQTITDTLAAGDLFVGLCCNGTAAPTMTTGSSDGTSTGTTQTASHGGIIVAHNSGTGSVSLVFATNSGDSSAASGVKLVAGVSGPSTTPALRGVTRSGLRPG